MRELSTPEDSRDVRPLVAPRRVERWGLLAVAMVMTGCSLVGTDPATSKPCDPADRIMALEPVTLANAESSATFDIPADRDVFVTLLADPNFNEGAGLNGGLVHASVFVIEDGADPRPGGPTDAGLFRSSPDFHLPRYSNVGDTHLVDRPVGTYRLWSGSGPLVEAFSCPSA